MPMTINHRRYEKPTWIDLGPLLFIPIPFWVIGVSIILGATVAFYECDESGIRRRNVFGMTKLIRWESITSVSDKNVLEVCSVNSTFKIRKWIHGWTQIRQWIANKTPHLPKTTFTPRPAEPALAPGSITFRPKGHAYLLIVGVVLIIFLIALTAGIFSLEVVNGRPESLWVIVPVIATFVLLAIWLISKALFQKYEITDSEFKLYDWRNQIKVIPLSAIQSVEFEFELKNDGSVTRYWMFRLADEYVPFVTSGRWDIEMMRALFSRLPETCLVNLDGSYYADRSLKQ